jgi:hypothetical protein
MDSEIDLTQLCTYLTMAFMECRFDYVQSKNYPAYDLYQQVYKLAKDNVDNLINKEESLLAYDDVVEFVIGLDLPYGG